MSVEREKSVFLAAIDCGTKPERNAYLDKACKDDPALRKAVEDLIAAHERPANVLDRQPDSCALLRRHCEKVVTDLRREASSGGSPADTDSCPDRAGERIGRYRLMEMIGEGGFGQVYVADQEKPIRRRVALKLLKPWMDSREVIARFEAERQALAMMDHPNIARVLDAGTSSAGQPYFVMELVRGVPITDFCTSHRLGVRERTELFIGVCEAVHHAHQKGVIHRDLKPSNVMVTLHDTRPVVKVIDFGVSKAIGEPLTDQTIYTRFAQMIGTPMYMSPEQAEMNALDVDTRSDVYSLGVLLYELLAGTTPFDRKRLNTATFDELRHIIREEDPPRPSSKVTTLSREDATRAVALAGKADEAASVLRGELDWVVMKAIEKDRRRRYESAAELARDVRRYLEQEPVVARPPSRLYRFRKLAQRNKVFFVATALVILVLIAGTAVSAWQAVRATDAYEEAEALRREAEEFADRLKEANVLVDSARANAEESRWNLAWTQYTKAIELQPEHYLAWSGRGALCAQRGAWRQAAADFSVALKLGAPANNPGWWGVPELCVYAGEMEAYGLIRAAFREQLDAGDETLSTPGLAHGLLVFPTGVDKARNLAAELDKICDVDPPQGNPGDDGKDPDPGDFARTMQKFMRTTYLQPCGLAHYRAGDHEQALRRLCQIPKSGPALPYYRLSLPILAMTYHATGRKEDAEAALASAGEALGEWIPRIHGNDDAWFSVPWFVYVDFYVLYREAHELIRGSPPPEEARLAGIERQALAVLRRE